MATEVNTAHLLTQSHQNHNQTKEQPPLRTVRNEVEWKYDNYRIKETTFIQTHRRGADAEWAGLSPTCGG